LPTPWRSEQQHVVGIGDAAAGGEFANHNPPSTVSLSHRGPNLARGGVVSGTGPEALRQAAIQKEEEAMRQRWRMSVLFSIAWMVLASGLPAHAGWPGSSQHRDDKKDDKKAEKDPKKVDQELAGLCVKDADWLAYFKDPDGTLAPMRDTGNSDHDEDWLDLRFTKYEGPRIRLGVLSVVNQTAETESSDGKEHLAVPAAGIQEMLTVALYNTKRFDVIEQKRIEEIKREQTRTDTTGLDPDSRQTNSPSVTNSARSKRTRTAAEISPSAIATVGKVLGAQYLVYGTVNEWTPDRINRSTSGPGGLLSHIPGAGSLVGAIGMPKLGKNEAEVAITITLADVGTGQVLYTTTQRARVGASHLDVGGEAGGESSEKTPVTYAIAASTNKAAFEIARFLQNRRWNGTIVAMQGATLYVNSGSQGGMQERAVLRVKKVIKKIFDEESHTFLGEDTDNLCAITVLKVAPNFSVARVVPPQDCPVIQVGYRVEMLDKELAPRPPNPACVAAEANLER
jgi:curli biogenesis system outer membrane secretion channel CsgG